MKWNGVGEFDSYLSMDGEGANSGYTIEVASNDEIFVIGSNEMHAEMLVNSTNYNFDSVEDSDDIFVLKFSNVPAIVDEAYYLDGCHIFPNPVADQLQIVSNDDLNEMVEIQLSNACGQLVIKKNIRLPKSAIDLSELPAGIYYLKIISSESQSVSRIYKR